jgi:hypothetical protein
MKGCIMLEAYKDIMDENLSSCYDFKTFFGRVPLFRYHTFKKTFELFKAMGGSTIVELGTIRSFVHGGVEGCNSDDTKYWNPNKCENWDWGAGLFSLVAAEEFIESEVSIHTVDISEAHINRSKVVTQDLSHKITYHVQDSLKFIENFESIYHKKVDLLYIDTGDMTPIEQTAQHQLKEAQAVVSSGVVTKSGLVLIDDVMNPAPIILSSEKSLLGKAKYSLPYLQDNNFEMILNEYQVLLRRV